MATSATPITPFTFAFRGSGKVMNGDTGRIGSVLCQWVNSIGAIKDSASIFGEYGGKAANLAGTVLEKADKGVVGLAEAMGKGNVVTEAVAKTGASNAVTALARTAVNPLLCAASVVRVLNDDDQYAAIVEEGAAMSAMFGAEKLVKKGRGNFDSLVKEYADDAAKTVVNSGNTKVFKDLYHKAAKSLANCKGDKKTFFARAAIDMVFVAASIAGFGIGKQIGKQFSNREEKPQTAATVNANPFAVQ